MTIRVTQSGRSGESAIVSLAILKVNWDRLGRDYLENFVPMVAETIRLSQNDAISLPAVQQEFLSQFGMRLPQNVINLILKRLNRQGYLKTQNGIFYRNADRLKDTKFKDVQQQVVRMHEKVVEELVEFGSANLKINWSHEDAEQALHSYLREHQLRFLTAAAQGSLIPSSDQPLKGAKFVVAAFIRHLRETHSGNFEYLETVVKGNMLANAIYLPDPSQAPRQFKHTEVYLDTGFVMYLLGYGGLPRRDPCIELIDLLYETGADLRCFTHTVDEARGILIATAGIIREGRLKDAYGPSVEYFLAEGYTPSDIELFASRLEVDLEAVRIRVTEKPRYVPRYTIGEEEFGKFLSSRVLYRKELALTRDVDSISAIMRLREGSTFYFAEDCRAILVTMNGAFARASRDFFAEDGRDGSLAPCITDGALTTLLWLKRPLQAPDLPRKRIVADCYAATQPDEELWRAYLVEIEKLRNESRVTPTDYYLLRHSLQARSVLMELTLGEEAAFTQGTVPEILRLVQSTLRKDLEVQLQSEMESRRQAEAAVQRERQKEIERNLRLDALAHRYARKGTQILEYGLLVFLFVGSVAAFPWGLPSFGAAALHYSLALAQITVVVLSIGNLMYGTRAELLIRHAEVVFAKWIRKRLSGLTQERV